ncbi:MAG: DNA translocase FtsK 4TM domain-containing protein, partial [Ignavibacteria bacterium]
MPKNGMFAAFSTYQHIERKVHMALPPDSIVINRKRNSIIDSLFDSDEEDMIVSKPRKSKKQENMEPEPEQESHRAMAMHILGIFMALSSLLLLLSLISYTPKDEANADMTIYDIISVLKGDPAIQAKSDTTQNWLGLFGAVFSHVMFNGTVGYFAIIVPFLGFLWAKDVFFSERITSKTFKFTGLITLIAILFSGLFGTMQLIIPKIPYEWSGLIGQFESHVLASFLGKIGALLTFMVVLFLTITLGFGISIKTSVNAVIAAFMNISMIVDRAIDFAQRKKQTQTLNEETVEEFTSEVQSSFAMLSPDTDEEPARIIRKRTQGLSKNETIIHSQSDQVPVIIRGNELLEDEEPMFVNFTRKQRPLPKKTEALPTVEVPVKKEVVQPKHNLT